MLQPACSAVFAQHIAMKPAQITCWWYNEVITEYISMFSIFGQAICDSSMNVSFFSYCNTIVVLLRVFSIMTSRLWHYMKIMCGVPQGSILGPLLFILYINDIVKVSTVLKRVLFADDTSLFHAHTDFDALIKEINEELKKVTTWFHTNKLSLNIKKSNFIMFLPKGKKYNTYNVKININGNEIKQVNFTKFLGIYIDEHLSWAQHIEFLSKKIARNIGMLSKLKHFLPIYIMNTLYYSLILSHLQYCTLLWANTYSTCLNKLRILQKKAIRIITQSHYLAHTDPLFSKLKLLKLDYLYKHQLGIYMYKSTKGLLPDSMSSMVIPIHNVHDHDLRNQNGYYIQHVRTNCRKFTIHYPGPVFWNTLPEQLREAVSENQFKR